MARAEGDKTFLFEYWVIFQEWAQRRSEFFVIYYINTNETENHCTLNFFVA